MSMTEPMSEEAAEHPRSYDPVGDIPPVKVQVVKGNDAPDGEVPETIKAATTGSWTSFLFLGTAADRPVRILGQDSRRKRAVIQGLPGFVSNNTQGNMWIGTKAQIINGNPAAAGAGVFVSGQSITVEAESEVWMMSDWNGSTGHELTVMVHDEIYRV